MRAPNIEDASLILRLYELRREKEMRKARNFIITFEPKTIDDVLAVANWAHPENAHFRQITSYWSMVADFAKRKILHPDMFAAHCGEAFVIYARLEPLLPEIRKRLSPTYFLTMEQLIKKYPSCREKAEAIRTMFAARAAAAAGAMKTTTSKKKASAK